MDGVALAIVGWRGMNEKDHQHLFNETLDKFVVTYGLPAVIVSGGATGADTMGEKWATARGIPTQIFKPQWRKNGTYDAGAGIKRNTDIVNACTHMIAFPSDKGKGTQDSIRKAKKQDKIVIEIKI
jgi:hypothetical protein